MKRCSKCETYKEESDFGKNKAMRDGLAHYCLVCNREYGRLQRRLNEAPEARKILGMKRATAWNESPENKAKRRLTNRAYRQRVRMDVVNHYGGKCECCKEPRREFLAIDHIEGGGRKHRAAVKKRGSDFYSWLKNNGYPDGFRILCHNCNSSLAYYGRCPHQDELPAFMSGAPWYARRIAKWRD